MLNLESRFIFYIKAHSGDYHFSFCDVIPPSCIQMRNIILSAFSRNMRLPDPSTPNLKMRQHGYSFLSELKHKLLLPPNDAARAGTRYNVPLVNSLVLYIGMQVCRDSRWGRCYESYSEDPKIVRAMTEFIPGLQGDIPSKSQRGFPFVAGKDKVAACAKHFVGDGGTTKGINENNTLISRQGLLNIHMRAYYDSIIKGVATIMVFY